MASAGTVEELYGLDLTEFTAARDALSKQFRAAGDVRAAEAVKQLRRPTLTVWALNRVARSKHQLIVAALEAGQALQAATVQVLGGDRSELPIAQTSERRAVDAVVGAVAAALDSAGHRLTDAAAHRVAATVRAGFADPEVEKQLLAGTLTEERTAAGFGLDPAAALLATPSRPAKAAKSKQRLQAEGKARQLLEEAQRLGETARQLQQEAADAERTAARARKEATRAEEAWRRADRRAKEVQSALEED